jgi:hypothetical protein
VRNKVVAEAVEIHLARPRETKLETPSALVETISLGVDDQEAIHIDRKLEEMITIKGEAMTAVEVSHNHQLTLVLLL